MATKKKTTKKTAPKQKSRRLALEFNGQLNIVEFSGKKRIGSTQVSPEFVVNAVRKALLE